MVNGLNLTVQKGEFVVLIGESGCGKTTTLEMVNRLIEPTKGSVLINGVDISTIKKSKLRRSIGYVIQSVGLLPHKTVEENIATVPLLCKKDEETIQNRVKDLMETIGLPYEEYAHRYPNQLSGGQQQRVGVARALANDPDIILLDEPFSALDPLTREQLQDELLRLHDHLNKTILFVTHDIDEAIKLADKIAIMKNGQIEQFDTPETILKHPKTEFVAEFIGQNRLWRSPDLLRAKDALVKNPAVIESTRTVVQAMELIRKHNTSILPVVDRTGKQGPLFVGFLGINEVLSATEETTRVCDIMKSDIVRIAPDMPLPEAIHLREQHNMKFTPVVDNDGRFVGLLSNASIIDVLSNVMPTKEDY